MEFLNSERRPTADNRSPIPDSRSMTADRLAACLLLLVDYFIASFFTGSNYFLPNSVFRRVSEVGKVINYSKIIN